MAQVREDVAKAVRHGDKFKWIVSGRDTKWETVKAFLWWLWYKKADILGALIEAFKSVLAVIICAIIALVTLAVFIVIGIPVGLVALVAMPIWFPILYWVSPAKAADILFDWGCIDGDCQFIIGANAWVVWNNLLFRVVGKFLFLRLAKAEFMPMSRRKYFLTREESLSSYPVDTQIEYLLEQDEEKREDVIGYLSSAAVAKLWREHLEMLPLVLEKRNISMDDVKVLFEADDEKFQQLLHYCANVKRQVNYEMQDYFVDQLYYNLVDRALKVLEVCAETDKRTLEDNILIRLIGMFDDGFGESVARIVSIYWCRNTLNRKVVEAIVRIASRAPLGGTDLAFELLKKIVRRDGVDNDLTELFFKKATSKAVDEMDEILVKKFHVSMLKAANDVWRNFCEITEDIEVEAQGGMNEEQYDIFKATGHHLKEEAVHKILTKVTESEKDFFEKVFNEAIAEDAISDATCRFLSTVKWKRERAVSLYAQYEKANKDEDEAED